MPNWCWNRVAVSGSEEDMKKLKEHVSSEESEFDFDKIIPMPKDINRRRSYRRYDWSRENWGTKWNSSDVSVKSMSDTDAVYTFLTAWSPPEPIILKLRELYPDINVSAFFDEPDPSHYITKTGREG